MGPAPSEYKPIDVMWESYRKDVVPPDAPETQVVESHRAFIGGACASFWLVMKATEVSEADALEIIAAIHKEVMSITEEAINEFIKTMPVGGHA